MGSKKHPCLACDVVSVLVNIENVYLEVKILWKLHTKLTKLILFRVAHVLSTIKKKIKKKSCPYPLKASDKILLRTCLKCDRDLDFGQCITSLKFRRNLLFLSSVSKQIGRDSWIKIDQLVFTCFIISLFNAQHVSNVSTSILRSLQLICWVISWVVLFWFDVCWRFSVVGLEWCGILMQAEALVLQH